MSNSSAKDAHRVSGIILAGGQGSRMNHANKGLQVFADKPLIQHVIERLQHQVDDIVISANEDLDTYRQFGYDVIADVSTSYGPLSGIQSAAQYVRHETIFITACDTPYLPTTIVAELGKDKESVVVAESSKGIEPLACLVDLEAIEAVEARIKNQQYSVVGWLKSCGVSIKDMTHLGDQAFANINTLADLSTT